MANDRDREIAKQLDAVAQGVESFMSRVNVAVADRQNGWFGIRVKIDPKGVRTVQITSDQQIPVDEPEKSE